MPDNDELALFRAATAGIKPLKQDTLAPVRIRKEPNKLLQRQLREKQDTLFDFSDE